MLKGVERYTASASARSIPDNWFRNRSRKAQRSRDMVDVVHVSFVGGGIFLPNEGPADRQYLVDYVAHLLHSKPKVQILRANERWMAERTADHCCCAGCGRASNATCREASSEGDIYCLRCALETGTRRSDEADDAARVRHLVLSSVGT